MQPNVLILFVTTVLFALNTWAAEEPARDPAKFFFSQTLGDLPEDLADAKAQGKKGIMLFFENDDCPFCHRMKTTVLNQPEVQAYYKKNFVMLSIDTEGSSELVDFDGNSTTEAAFFAKVARNRGATPVIAFFDLQGQMVVRYTGATTGVDEFLLLGQYASDGVYTDMSFTKFKRQQKQAN